MTELIIKSNSASMPDDIRDLAQAFLLAKKEFSATGLSGKNTGQKYDYAKIGDIYNAVEESLAKNNIIIWHFARPESGIEFLYTRLIHTLTGQYLEDVRTLESEKPGNQAKGAANTYMKKYAVLSLCSIATEDDDGAEEQKYIEKKYTSAPIDADNEDSLSNVVSSKQVWLLDKTIKETTQTDAFNRILKKYRIGSLAELPITKCNEVLAWLKGE